MTLNNPKQFANNFLSKFLENGFGSLPKREIEIYIINLLLEDGQFINDNREIDFHEISLMLKVSETKVRNLIYEVELKYRNNHNFLKQLIELIEKQKYEVDKDKIKFSIQSPLLKQYFEYEIRKLPNSISDGSFSKNIVTISKETFEKLLKNLYQDEDKIQEFIHNLPEDKKKVIKDKDTLFNIFVEEFVRGAGKKGGEKSIELVFNLINPIDFLKELINE
jgi:uncharacterized protein YaaW (UPF0174 family)